MTPISAPLRQPERKPTGVVHYPDIGFFLILRLYSPKEAYFNKTWKPSDIEKVTPAKANTRRRVC
jgi:hypothetical protein